MDTIIDRLTESLGGTIPNVLAALAILVVGWLVALVIAAVVRGIMKRTTLDNRAAAWVVGKEKAEGAEVERWVSRAVFWLIMIFVVIGTFQALGLTLVTEPLNRLLVGLFEFFPRLLGAGVLIAIAWIVGTVLRKIVTRALQSIGLDDRIGSQAPEEGAESVAVTKTLGDAVYWLVFLLFLPAILSALALEGLLLPVQAMLNKILGFLPNIATAAIIALVGWFVARIVQRIVTNLLAAAGADRLGERAGLDRALGAQKLSGLIGLIVYVVILIPVIVAALNAVQLEAVSGPASNMLNLVLEALPNIFAAAVVLIVSYVVGRLLAGLVSSLLAGIGFNNVLAWLGVGTPHMEGDWTPSAIVGRVVLLAIMLFAVTEALGLLGFVALVALVSQFLFFAGGLAMGLIILGIGLYLSNLAAKAIRSAGTEQANMLALVARVSILLLAGAMALRQMGLADEIIMIGFGLIVGAVAVAVAVAFGVGGRDLAKRELERWSDSYRK